MRARCQLLGWTLCAGLLGATPGAAAEPILVAVAANVAAAIEPLAAAFEQASGHRLEISSGSSGTLFAQIRNGAPFEVLLSADAERPRQLELAGSAVEGTRFTYAVGRLALWAPHAEDAVEGPGLLEAGRFRHLAMADPQTAPYGLAAQVALENLGLWERLAERLVRGESVAQAHQFVASGAAEIGLVALSQVVTEDPGTWWTLPETLHPPLEQQAVLLVKGRGSPAAGAFLEFLASEPARRILERFGYGLPTP